MTISNEHTATFDATDGTRIFYRHFAAQPEKARMVIAHGLGEHSGRYGNVTAPLMAAGVSLWLPDHRGHGRSGGRRGHVSRFDQYVEDLDRIVEIAREALPPGRKCFLLGHSMGGLIAVRYAQRHPEKVDGLILSSPALGMVLAVPPAKKWLAAFTSALFPGLSLSNELDPGSISRDEAVVQAYREDPLVHDRVSTRWFTEFLASMQSANNAGGDIRMPVLMQVAGDDHLVSAPAAERFFGLLGSADKQLRRYEGMYHEVYNAPADQRSRVLGDLVDWVCTRF
jgi:alpha-beta hydrolase superfamily lysophospholipase